LTLCGETSFPVARTSTTDNSLNTGVVDSKLAEILKPLFERTSKGTRITGEPVLDNVIRTVLPVLTTSASIEFSGTERATVSLTWPVSVTELCAFTPAGTKIPTAMSVRKLDLSLM
jgi:hypothetical protein